MDNMATSWKRGAARRRDKLENVRKKGRNYKHQEYRNRQRTENQRKLGAEVTQFTQIQTTGMVSEGMETYHLSQALRIRKSKSNKPKL